MQSGLASAHAQQFTGVGSEEEPRVRQKGSAGQQGASERLLLKHDQNMATECGAERVARRPARRQCAPWAASSLCLAATERQAARQSAWRIIVSARAQRPACAGFTNPSPLRDGDVVVVLARVHRLVAQLLLNAQQLRGWVSGWEGSASVGGQAVAQAAATLAGRGPLLSPPHTQHTQHAHTSPPGCTWTGARSGRARPS